MKQLTHKHLVTFFAIVLLKLPASGADPNLYFTYNLANEEAVPLTVDFTDTLPSGLLWDTAFTPATTGGLQVDVIYTDGDSTATVSNITLPPGACTLTLRTAGVSQTGTIENDATITPSAESGLAPITANANIDLVPTSIPSFPTNAVLSQDSVSRLYSIQVDPSNSQGSYTPISGANSQGEQYNGMGYRPADGMLYGMNPSTGRLLKVNPATGDATIVANLSLTQGYAGDFNTDNGLYYVKTMSQSKFHVIDVIAGAIVQQIDITPAVGSIGDITYNAADGKFYSYHDADKRVYVIDATTGARTTLPSHASNPSGHCGAAFAKDGNVFFAANSGGLYWLDPADGKLNWIADSPSSSRNDGALLADSSSPAEPTIVLSEGFEGASPGLWNNGFWDYDSGQNFSDSEHGPIPDGGSQYGVPDPSPTQATVDLPGLLTASQLAAVTAGTGSWDFTAWLASWKNDGAFAVFSVEWFDGLAGAGNSLGNPVLADGSSSTNVVAVVNGAVLENDAANWNADNWSQYVTSGSVPAGAQSFVLTYSVNSGSDGYADNLSFSISEAP